MTSSEGKGEEKEEIGKFEESEDNPEKAKLLPLKLLLIPKPQ